MIITASPPRRPNRTRRVLIGIGIWLSLALIFFVWAGLQNASYRGQHNAFISGMKQALDAAPAQLKQAKDAGDTAGVVIALSNLSTLLTQKIDNAPVIPSVLGLRVGVDAESRTQDAVVAAAKDAARSLRQSADFIDFQSKLARSLQALSLKDVGNHDQIIALADAWKEAANSLQHTPKPSQLTDVSATLLQKMVVAESRIRELATLHKQGDSAGFTTKQRELAVIIDEIKPLGVQILAISATLDSDLQRSLAALRQNL
jgi:hypothetical protein